MKEKEKQHGKERHLGGEKKEDCEEEGKGSAAGRDKEREGKWEEKRKERGGKVCMCLLDGGELQACAASPPSPATTRGCAI